MTSTVDQPTSQTQQPSERTRKTHTSLAVISALKKLPCPNKLKRNDDIESHNAERALQHARHEEDPDCCDMPSEDESFIIVSEAEEVLSPASTVMGIMAKLSPTSAKNLMRSFMGTKRTRDVDKAKKDEGARKVARIFRKEIHLQPGMSLPAVFHALLTNLFDNNIYIPLSLFTSPNLEIIKSTAATLAMIKLNVRVPGDKQLRVLDTVAFKEKYLKEADMDCGQWTEASRNKVVFIEEITGSATSDLSLCFNTHFGFFEHAKNQEENYPAILATDIALRRKYMARPFVFDPVFYDCELNKAVTSMHIKQMTDTLSGAPAPPAAALATHIANGGGGCGSGGGTRGTRGSRSGHGARRDGADIIGTKPPAPLPPLTTTSQFSVSQTGTTFVQRDPAKHHAALGTLGAPAPSAPTNQPYVHTIAHSAAV
ncbi:hypothetical protein C8R43DRAFT_1140174 [Mycena crocata]|nr:hypothetical protein C8R43DRAFT_1140174 [Mycena crocata]